MIISGDGAYISDKNIEIEEDPISAEHDVRVLGAMNVSFTHDEIDRLKERSDEIRSDDS